MADVTHSEEMLIGIEGLALLRHLHEEAGEAAAERRIDEVRALLAQPTGAEPIGAEPIDAEPASEVDPRAGYARWSESYDEPGNPIVSLEQPAVWSMLACAPPGRALDAACDTGRHTRRLVDLGHETVGVDLTPEMLERARQTVPEAHFAHGDLRALPAPDAHFDVVVCGLALAHLPELAPAVGELARVLAPGGRLVISALHPFQVHLGWHAEFTGADGRRGFVREHPHPHADYLRTFRAAGLEVLDCSEPRLQPVHVQAKRRAFRAIPDASLAAYVGLPAVLVWHLCAA